MKMVILIMKPNVLQVTDIVVVTKKEFGERISKTRLRSYIKGKQKQKKQYGSSGSSGLSLACDFLLPANEMITR